MTRELHCVGYMGPRGYAQVTRIGSIWRVYAGRSPSEVKVRCECSHEEDALRVARQSAFRSRVPTREYGPLLFTQSFDEEAHNDAMFGAFSRRQAVRS